jgi:hypothetical protein
MPNSGVYSVKRYMMINDVKVEVDENNKPITSARMSNSSTNSQKLDNYSTMGPVLSSDGRNPTTQSYQYVTSGYLAPPPRVSAGSSATTTFQTSVERSQPKIVSGSIPHQSGTYSSPYTSSQLRPSSIENGQQKTLRYAPGGSYGLQTVQKYNQIPEEVLSNRNSVSNSNVQALPSTSQDKKKTLENFEDLPIEDLLREQMGFDRSKHVPSNPRRTLARQSSSSQVIAGNSTAKNDLKAAIESTKDTMQAKLNTVGYDLGLKNTGERPLGDALRNSVHNVKEIFGGTLAYANQMRPSQQPHEIQAYNAASMGQPIYRIANQVGDESQKATEKQNALATIAKLMSSHLIDPLNNKATQYGLDVSDGGVLLVASTVMTTMMLIVFWMLIRSN